MEPGFAIYDIKGTELYKAQHAEKFKQFLWRPRPRTLLSTAQQKAIIKNLRKYGREFDELDQLEEMNVSSELQEQRRRLVDEWNAWRQRVKQQLEEDKAHIGWKTRKDESPEEEQATEVLEEWIEEVLEETEEVVV
jgi:translation initiation factor 3 subunit B